MTVYDYIDDDGEFTSIWSHPDIESVDDLIDAARVIEIECPDDDQMDPCTETINIGLSDAEDDIPDMIDHLERKDGTLRCSACDEPLYGIYGDGDYDDPEESGWFDPTAVNP